MGKVVTMDVDVRFGDCDPAGIVFFPNFSRWMDAASLHFFMQCGVPPWRELQKTHGIIGTPIVELHTRYHRPATYGETLQVHTEVEEWRGKVFVQRHRVMRGDELLCEGRETRAFCIRDEEGRLRAVPAPEDIRALCT
ncbi:MAG TPA: acyl-CoA thioesterase [Burkholderiaceae bacterium]|nr:acyl-CoA thioesterase [Burkholderiaceae bacterium]